MNAQYSFISAWSLRLWLVICCFEGALRYYLESKGLGMLIYSKDVLLGICALAAIAEGALLRNWILTVVVVMILGLGGLIGRLGGCSTIAVLFGYKVLFPTLVGIAFGLSRLTVPRATWQATFLFSVCLGGVVVNYLIPQLPWTGSTQDVMGVKIEGSREWDTVGVTERISRPAGFSRASFTVAWQLLCIGVIVQTRSSSRWSRLLWLAVLAGILLTASKAVILAWLVTTALMLLSVIDPRELWSRTVTVCLIAPAVCIIPVIASSASLDTYTLRIGSVFSALTESFFIRGSFGWPDAFQLAQNGPFGMELGCGIGAVGAAAEYFQRENWNPGDNLFVYLFMEFGFLAVVIMIACLIGLLLLKNRDEPDAIDNSTLWFLGLSALTCGLTSNVIEDPVMAFCLWSSIGRGLSVKSAEFQEWQSNYDDDDDDDDEVDDGDQM